MNLLGRILSDRYMRAGAILLLISLVGLVVSLILSLPFAYPLTGLLVTLVIVVASIAGVVVFVRGVFLESEIEDKEED